MKRKQEGKKEGGGNKKEKKKSELDLWVAPAILKFGSVNLESNQTLLHDTPMAIDFRSLETCILPADWSQRAGGERAAKHTEFFAQLMGSLTFTFEGVSLEKVKKFTAATKTRANGGEISSHFDKNGEWATPFGQIPVSRLVEIESQSSSQFELLQAVLSLQKISSSKWKLPLIKVISNHTYINSNLEVKLSWAVAATSISTPTFLVLVLSSPEESLSVCIWSCLSKGETKSWPFPSFLLLITAYVVS